MADASLILHDWSPIEPEPGVMQHCVNCGQARAGASVECVPTTAEPGADE